MLKRFLAVVALSALTWGCQSTQRMDTYATYGAPTEPEGSVSLASAVAHADKGDESPLWVSAKISEVCQNRGCWMMLADERHEVRVRFTASEQCTEGFLVPRNAAGRMAYARGVVKPGLIPQDLARHYAEEAGKPKEEVEKIVGPQQAYTMVATSVWIADGKSLDPPVQ